MQEAFASRFDALDKNIPQQQQQINSYDRFSTLSKIFAVKNSFEIVKKLTKMGKHAYFQAIF